MIISLRFVPLALDETLLAVVRGAVHQLVRVPDGIVLHAEDAEETPLGVEQAGARFHRPQADRRQRGHRGAEDRRPAPQEKRGEGGQRHHRNPHHGAIGKAQAGKETVRAQPPGHDQAEQQGRDGQCHLAARSHRGRRRHIGRGRNRQAAAIISGYSSTLLKTTGATRALNNPPTTPPSDIQR